MQNVADEWQIEEGVIYLNHGSFGPSPAPVIRAREEWLRRLEREPMDFFVRHLCGYLDESADKLGRFVGCSGDNLIFVPNSTAGMNIAVANIPLAEGDEVLLTDHEYGAVVRIWGKACQQAGAKTVLARLPLPLTSKSEIVDAIFEQVTDRTRVIVASHVTSQTAVKLPVKEICERARERGIFTVIDGPHAVAMTSERIDSIPCDYYAASCHKWLSAPFGSGFLYVRSRHKQGLKPNIWSWGKNFAGAEPSWKDEFHWPGTFDPTPFLTIPAAIDFLEEYGRERFQQETQSLASNVRQRLLELGGGEALTPNNFEWYGSMASVPFPIDGESGAFPVEMHPLQAWLRDKHGIEVPIIHWKDRTMIRVSCHLYTQPAHLDRLRDALEQWRSR